MAEKGDALTDSERTTIAASLIAYQLHLQGEQVKRALPQPLLDKTLDTADMDIVNIRKKLGL